MRRKNARIRKQVKKPATEKRIRQKDLALKTFVTNNDVFADILNFVLPENAEKISENELETESAAAVVYYDNRISRAERDVIKICKHAGVRICAVGMENQSEIDPDMVFRTLIYDGSSYLSFIRKGKKIEYPVFTIVLYFGKRPWNNPVTLYETLNVPEFLRLLVNDWKMTLIDVRRITDTDIERFKSDFRSIAELLKNEENMNYKGDTRELVHKGEIIDIMNEFGITALTNTVKSELTEGYLNMRKVLSEDERRRITAEKRAEGKAEGKAETKADDVRIVMSKLKMSVSEAMAFLEIPDAEQSEIRGLLRPSA